VSATLQQGRIIWVELLDPQGRNPKRRPAVILTLTEEIRPEGEVVVAALSSQTDQSSQETSVEVPWHRKGHPRTKLNRRNVVVCTWLATVPVTTIRLNDIGGIVPFAQMARVLEIVRSLEGVREDQPPAEPEATP
jgi:mRNA-degrading endonuclease toxin of MazEF toxin-antitoxin module